MDLSLLKNIDGVEEKVTQLSSPIRITINISVAYRGTNRTFTMVRVHSGAAAELVDLDDDPNTVTFETNQFSTYALTYKDAATKEEVSGKKEALDKEDVSEKDGSANKDAVTEKLPKTGVSTNQNSQAGKNSPLIPLGMVVMVVVCVILVKRKKKAHEILNSRLK